MMLHEGRYLEPASFTEPPETPYWDVCSRCGEEKRTDDGAWFPPRHFGWEEDFVCADCLTDEDEAAYDAAWAAHDRPKEEE